VEDSLESILHANSGVFTHELSEIGLTIAPILARSLLSYSPKEKAWALEFFESFVYEPVIPVLIELTSDGQASPAFIGEHYRLTVGELAIYNLYDMARTSDRARTGLISVLSKKPLSREFREWLNPGRLLGDEFKPTVRGKRVSTRARNTG